MSRCTKIVDFIGDFSFRAKVIGATNAIVALKNLQDLSRKQKSGKSQDGIHKKDQTP